jgi:inosine-uridine nucleoside N-ribohydrolase
MSRILIGCLLFVARATASEAVIFDTDSGVFGDDGAALVMLARSPQQVNVLGFTIVPGNVWSRQAAEYVHHILKLLHRSPDTVYAGTEGPLINSAAAAKEAERRWGALEYTGAFAQDSNRVKPAPGASLTGRKVNRTCAVQFMIEQVEKHPGEITILAAGPMTNVALMLTLRPDLAPKVKQIVFMGGNIRVAGNASPAAEFNFWFDPEAARIVLRSRIPKKIMFGLDICNRAQIRKAQFAQIVAVRTPITELYGEDLGKRYPGFYQNPDAKTFLWDSLAAAWLIDPDFVTASQTLYLDAQTCFGKFYGATIPLDRHVSPQATPVVAMLDLNFSRVWKLYKTLLTRAQ